MKPAYTTAELVSLGLEKNRFKLARRAEKEGWTFILGESQGGKPPKLWRSDSFPQATAIEVDLKERKNTPIYNDAELSPPAPTAAPSPADGALLPSNRGAAPLTRRDRPPLSTPTPEDRLQDGRRRDLVRLYLAATEDAPHGRRKVRQADWVTAYNAGLLAPELLRALGPTSTATLERYKVALKRDPSALLVDRRGRHRSGCTALLPAQEEIVLRCALHPNRPKLSEAIRWARMAMERRGVPDGLSDATYRRFLGRWKSRNAHLWAFTRGGAKYWNDTVAQYIERDPTLINVGDLLVADGHILNFEIRGPDGKDRRMMLLVWLDWRSRFPAGWEILPTENVWSIASALRRAILMLGKIPAVGYLDNGRAFRARFFEGCKDFEEAGLTGLFERLGMKTIHAWPYHGQSKPVERFFKTFGELERILPTYVGTDIMSKPPRMCRGERLHRAIHEKSVKPLTLEEAHYLVAWWFDLYASRPSRAAGLEGRTPYEVFMEGRGPGVDEYALRDLMLAEKKGKIFRDGVHHEGRRYYAPELYGRTHACLVRYDRMAPASILVYDEEGRFLCEAVVPEKCHPAAYILGDREDEARLEKAIHARKRQEKEASALCRGMLAQVMADHESLIASAGVAGGSTKPLLPPSPEESATRNPQPAITAPTPEQCAEVDRLYEERQAERARAAEERAASRAADDTRYAEILHALYFEGQTYEEQGSANMQFMEQYEKSFTDEERAHWAARRMELVEMRLRKEDEDADK